VGKKRRITPVYSSQYYFATHIKLYVVAIHKVTRARYWISPLCEIKIIHSNDAFETAFACVG